MREQFFIGTAVAIGLLASAAIAGAQTCTGSAPMGGLSLQLGASVGGAVRPTPAFLFSGKFGAGYKWIIGSIDYSANNLTDLGYGAEGLSATLGVQLPAWRDRLWLCPIVLYGRSVAESPVRSPLPPFEELDKLKQVTAFRSVSMAVGWPIGNYRNMTLVPTVSGGVNQSYLIYTEFLFQPTGVKTTSLTLQAGVGLIFGRRTSVTLAVATSPWNSEHFDSAVSYLGTITINVK